MAWTKRVRLALPALAAAVGLMSAGSAGAAVPPELLVDPCLGSDLGAIKGTPGDDQIWGNGLDNLIFGYGGNDVIKGLGGDDKICGGDGNDAINGGGGIDIIGGGAGNDILVGTTGDDGLFGGKGVDALYGGPNDDDLTANDDVVDPVAQTYERDYVVGGTGTDALHTTAADEAYQDDGANTACPRLEFALIGVRRPARLKVIDEANPCRTVSGNATSVDNNPGDGDRVFTLPGNGLVDKAEFMPRDNGKFAVHEGNQVTVTGLYVYDTNHPDDCVARPPQQGETECNKQIHPVFKLIRGASIPGEPDCPSSNPCYSGPRYAGSPWEWEPLNLVGTGDVRYKYCWDEVISPCDPYGAEPVFQ